jgi:hypothetical protein
MPRLPIAQCRRAGQTRRHIDKAEVPDARRRQMKKWLLGTGAVLLLAIGAGAWWLFGNIDAVVKRAITRYGSEMTQALVSVDAVQLRSSDGAGTVRGLTVGNPAGFTTPYALKVGVIDVAVELRTLADPVVVVQRIVIESPDLIYEKGATQTNFEAIQKNIASALGSRSAGGTGTGSAKAPARKLIVDELIIRNARARAAAPLLAGKTMSVTLPDIVLHHIGRVEGGITPAQLGEVVARTLSQRLIASLPFERLLKSLGERIKGLFN